MGRARLQLLADDAAKGVLEAWGFAVEVFPKRCVDQSLATGGAAGGLGELEETVEDVRIEADCDSDLVLRFGFRSKPLPLP